MSYKYSWTEIEVLKQNWKNIAVEFNGSFKTIKNQSFDTADPYIRSFDLKIPFIEGKICINTSEFRPLKLCYNFSEKIPGEFIIYPEDFMDKIAKFLGAKELETGNKEFDNKFFIKGNDKKLIESILTKKHQEYLINNQIINLKLEKNKNHTKLELNIVINELEYSNMKSAIDLFRNVLLQFLIT